MPVATGYVRLATLEWANEVAKAARDTTSVATIEPPEDRQGRQPHAPGSACLAHVRAHSRPALDTWQTRRLAPPSHRGPVANRYTWLTSTMLDFPDRGAPFRIMICPCARVCPVSPPLLPHDEITARLAEIRCHIIARSRSILAPSGNILSFAQQVGLTCSSVGVSLADQIEDRTFSPNCAPVPPGQSAPPVASMSRATAAVQDCSLEPSASPVNGSKYSAKPPSESSSRVSRRIL